MKHTVAKEARKLCTHTVVFTDPISRKAAALALRGQSTKAIAAALKITIHEAQYRINKAQKSQGRHYRADYRNNSSPLTQRMLLITERLALSEIDNKVAPKFIPLARAGVPRSS